MNDPKMTVLPAADRDVSMIERPWTWRDKIRCKLFPPKHCDWPDAPPFYRDGLSCRITGYLSLLDRVRILFTGRVVVESRTITEHVIGGHKTSTVFMVLPPKWMERP